MTPDLLGPSAQHRITAFTTQKGERQQHPNVLSIMEKLLFVAASLLLVGAQTGDIAWGVCPPNQASTTYKTDCANISYPLNYNNLSMGNVNAFVRRIYATEVTGSSLWMVNGGPGDSALVLVPVCDFFISMDNSFTCYAQDARGTGLSSYMNCADPQPYGAFNPYSAASVQMYDDCMQNIIENYGPVLPYYSTYNAMKDVLGTVISVNADLVHIYAQSYGTYALNMYLQLEGALADAIVLDGPVPPNRWPFEHNGEWTSQVAQDVAHECAANSTVCSDRISDMGHIPMLVMDAVIDGTLPCLRNLSWLNATDVWSYCYRCYVYPPRLNFSCFSGPFLVVYLQQSVHRRRHA